MWGEGVGVGVGVGVGNGEVYGLWCVVYENTHDRPMRNANGPSTETEIRVSAPYHKSSHCHLTVISLSSHCQGLVPTPPVISTL